MTVTYSKLGKNGRLGNQLFQIASTIGIATKNGQDYVFPMWEHEMEFTNKLPTDYLLAHKTYKEMNTGYHEIVLSDKFDWDLDGYFQSWKYFSHCKDLIKKQFKFNFQTNDHSIDLVSVHVRRGDYTKLSHVHPILGENYYKQAMSLFPNDNFIVFSDDIDFCINSGWFDHKECTFKVSESSRGIETSISEDLLHLAYMSKCKGHIIANSSYSWWAAYLSGNEKVIAPKLWVHGETTDDRVPPEWIKI